MVSIIIPARGEIFLEKTIQDLLAKATGEIEIIPVLDGYWPTPQKREHWETPAIIEDPRVHYLHRGVSYGMRAAINAGVALSKGDYIMKIDAHCMVAEGFDEALVADYEERAIIIPRRKRLEPETWSIQDVGKPDVDYEFLSFPLWKPEEVGIHGTIWTERIRERLGKPEFDIDEDMSFQGSCWFMSKRLFLELGGMQEAGYGTFIAEPQELGLKVWLSGGRQLVNKKTWYAHLHKGRTYGRGYSMDKHKLRAGNAYSCDFWMNNKWKDRKHNIGWLVERFWPVPTWPEDWEKQWAEYTKNGHA